MNPPTIGLFGTCGQSHWRKPFLAAYAKAGLSYYNPQLEPGTWKPEMAKLENDHLYNDNIIIYVITDETTAEGSLPEIGFALNGIAESAGTRYAIIFIDRECKDPGAAKRRLRIPGVLVNLSFPSWSTTTKPTSLLPGAWKKHLGLA